MLLNTKHFGEIEYDKKSVIVFDEGIPGFDEKEFIMLADNPDDLFCWLQSVEDGDIAFVLMDVKQIMPDYNPKIEPEVLDELKSGDEEADLSYYNITVVPDDLKDMRVNLKAPVIINNKTCRGKQAVASNEEYSLRHYIFNELETHRRKVM